MICPFCRSPVETLRKMKQAAPETRVPLSQPKHKAWFVCEECASISRFVLAGAKMMLRIAAVDEFADSSVDRDVVIAARQTVLKRIDDERIAADARERAALLKPKRKGAAV